MNIELSERLHTEATKSDVLARLREQFEPIAKTVSGEGDKFQVCSILATFGSINRDDETTLSLRSAPGGWLLTAKVDYTPSLAFWILFLLGIPTVLVWLLPVAFYLYHFHLVCIAVRVTFTRVRHEFDGVVATQREAGAGRPAISFCGECGASNDPGFANCSQCHCAAPAKQRP